MDQWSAFEKTLNSPGEDSRRVLPPITYLLDKGRVAGEYRTVGLGPLMFEEGNLGVAALCNLLERFNGDHGDIVEHPTGLPRSISHYRTQLNSINAKLVESVL